MGCGVAALAGITCSEISTVIQLLLLILAIAAVCIVAKVSKPANLLRNELILAGVLISPFVWAHFSGANRLAVVRAQLQEFQSLCYDKSHERIRRRAGDVKAPVLSPKSDIIGAWSFELFFGMTRPKKWGGMPVVTAWEGAETEGVYELRYSYLPEERTISGTPTLFRGVRQQIFDLQKKELIAERVNYIWGDDFNRSATCLGMGWYEENDGFADRVLGYRYAQPGLQREAARGPEWHLKAVLTSQQDADVDLRPINERWIVVDNFKYDLYGWSESLREPQSGKNHALAEYLKKAPYGFNSIMEFEGNYVLTFFSAGTLRNRPPKEILLVFITKDGKELKRIYAQIPAVMEWTNGWGFSPGDVSFSKTDIRLQLYGKKDRTGQYSDQNNEGRYSKRYMFSIRLPEIVQQ